MVCLVSTSHCSKHFTCTDAFNSHHNPMGKYSKEDKLLARGHTCGKQQSRNSLPSKPSA